MAHSDHSLHCSASVACGEQRTSPHDDVGDAWLKRDAKSPFIFVSERGAPFTVSGLQKMIERAGIEAKMPFKVHPHMLRHATGYALANKGHRHPDAAGLLGPSLDPIDGKIHRACAG